jgi:hypothetical protein
VGYKATGTIRAAGETQQVSARFEKREFVLEIAENPRYPQLVQFQLTGNRCAALDDFRVGDEVEVEFSLRGREWTSPRGEVKYFNSLDVWAIEPVGARPAGGGGGGETPEDDVPPPDEPDEIPTDDIPF